MLENIKNQADNSLMPTYAHFPVSIESGNGATFIDSEGNEVIDFGSSIGVNSLGYNNEGWIYHLRRKFRCWKKIGKKTCLQFQICLVCSG